MNIIHMMVWVEPACLRTKLAFRQCSGCKEVTGTRRTPALRPPAEGAWQAAQRARAFSWRPAVCRWRRRAGLTSTEISANVRSPGEPSRSVPTACEEGEGGQQGLAGSARSSGWWRALRVGRSAGLLACGRGRRGQRGTPTRDQEPLGPWTHVPHVGGGMVVN